MFGHAVLDAVAVGSFLGFPPQSDDPGLTPVVRRRDSQYFKCGSRRMLFQISEERVELLLSMRACRLSVDGTRSNAGTVRDVLKQWQQRHRLADSLKLCTRVWCPIAASVLLGSWPAIPLQLTGRDRSGDGASTPSCLFMTAVNVIRLAMQRGSPGTMAWL